MTDLARVKEALRGQRIETPSWAYGNSGTRFKVSPRRGCRATRTRRSPTRRPCTGSPGWRRRWRCTSRGTRSTTTPTLAALRRGAGRRARRDQLATCSRTTTTSSAASPTPTRRCARKATDHLLECVDIMDATGSRDLKLWFSDGTNYPGQDNIRARQDRLAEALREVYDRLGDDQRMLLEYKLFEPAFYTTDVPDWGTPYAHCLRARASGAGRHRHRAPRAGHEHRVHRGVPAAGRASSAAFDFNSRFYADDDLMVGAADPFQLFRIMHEIVLGGRARPGRGHRVHARPVPQHRAEDPGGHPVGDERPGGHREGAAGRPRRAAPRPSATATCSARTRC